MPRTFREFLSFTILLLGATFIIWICLFKVHAPDFWWNMKAGQIMRESGWITLEPFAYTREGAPYLATQSWLAQIIFSLAWDMFGAGGVIALRTLLLMCTLTFLLLIDRRHIWPNAILLMFAAVIFRGYLLDRPQLFTYLMFSAAIFTTLKLLDIPNESPKISSKFVFKWLGILILIQLLWVNLHGAAAILTIGLLGAVLLQHLYELVKKRTSLKALISNQTIKLLLIGLVALVITSFLSPNGLRNITYIISLYTDKTVQFILEWQSIDTLTYWKQIGIFWLIGIGGFAWTLKKPVATSIIFLALAFMSLNANRHIPLFVITSIGLTFYQLKFNDQWKKIINKLTEKLLPATVITLAAFAVILFVNEPVRSMFAQEDMTGIGTHEPVSTAYDFIENTQPTGNMFNSYSIGQYLLYRGYPDRKIFVDGRNVDHGYEFLKKTFDAARDGEDWKDIEEKYDLTYAIIDYRPKRDPNAIYPYSHLDENPNWHLVFVDDLIAIYLKDIPQHKSIIQENEYKILTAQSFGRQTVFDEVDQRQAKALTDELLRQANEDPQGITSLLLLAKIFTASQIYENALMSLEEAMQRKPQNHEPYELAASVYDKMGETQKADEMYEKAKKLAK